MKTNSEFLYWLGGLENMLRFTPEHQSQYPAIAKLGQLFNDFQNGQWRGEYEQRTALTFGDVKDVLGEIATLLKEQTPAELFTFEFQLQGLNQDGKLIVLAATEESALETVTDKLEETEAGSQWWRDRGYTTGRCTFTVSPDEPVVEPIKPPAVVYFESWSNNT